ncbi:peptidase inhibitor family I36 protein [Streptomyces sp. NPDC058394]|uniref:peptidase inhibitor family I36 protein n=1 Tax=Streptomyces sp. NPDC058394 TaxID=3346477 RepID=UPI0036571876
MSRTRTIMVAGVAMAAALTLGACSGEGSNNAGDGRKPSGVSVKDGPDPTALPAESVAPAAAVAGCEKSEALCLYQDVDYKGRIPLPAEGCFDDLRRIFLSNDRASSVVNNSAEPVRLFEGVNRSGRYIEISPNSASPDLRSHTFKVFNNDGSTVNDQGEFNDVTSSVCIQK